MQTPSSRARRSRRTAAVVGTLLPMTLIGLAPAGPAAAEPTVTREEIFAALNVDQVPADYVVLVDTSNSMYEQNRYGRVRQTLLPFLSGLSDTDRVALFTFDDFPALRYDGPAGSPATIVGKLPPGPTPNGRTDIGAAVDAAVKRLERNDAADVATVVLVTDGAHRAPGGSPYRTAGSPAWTTLTRRAASLSATSVNAYALPLGPDSGAGLLGEVLPGATVLDASSVQNLAGYLDQAKEATRLSKAEEALAGDVGQGVEVRWRLPDELDLTHGPVTVQATLRSATAKVPLTVAGLTATTDGPVTARAAVPDITLAPGASERVDVELSWSPAAGFPPVRDTRTRHPALVLTGAVTSPWAAALEPDVPLGIPAAPIDGAPRTTVTATVGQAWVLPVLLVGIALAVLLVAVLIYRRRYPFMPGMLSVSAIGSDRELTRVPLDRRRPIDLRVPGMPGNGRVRGRRDGPAASLLISFSPDGSTDRLATSVCPPRESIIVSGLAFAHRYDEPAGRTS